MYQYINCLYEYCELQKKKDSHPCHPDKHWWLKDTTEDESLDAAAAMTTLCFQGRVKAMTVSLFLTFQSHFYSVLTHLSLWTHPWVPFKAELKILSSQLCLCFDFCLLAFVSSHVHFLIPTVCFNEHTLPTTLILTDLAASVRYS